MVKPLVRLKGFELNEKYFLSTVFYKLDTSKFFTNL